MNRKTSAVIRIVSWSIVAVILTIVLIMGVLGNWNVTLFPFGNHTTSGGWTYAESGKYTAGPAELPADIIKNIRVNWLDGSITLSAADTDQVIVKETSSQKLSTKEQLHYYLKGDTLLIEYRGATKNIITAFANGLSKKLEIQIPRKYADSFQEILVDGVSSDINLDNLKTKKLSLDNVSGDIRLKNVESDTLSANTTSGSLNSTNLIVSENAVTNSTSGDVILDGSLTAVQHDSVSGDLQITSAACPENIQAGTTSGSVTLNIPANSGFTLEYDTVSGDLESDFPTTGSDSRRTYESGKCHFRIDTVSGSMKLSKTK